MHGPVGAPSRIGSQVDFDPNLYNALATHVCARHINTLLSMHIMPERTMPVCFTTEQYRMIEEYAKSRGMLNTSQALESLLKSR